MSREHKLILEMVKEGKISIEEAEKLLESQAVREPQGVTGLGQKSSKPVNKKFLKMIVQEGDTTKVNINVPLALAEVGLKLIPKDQLKIKGAEIDIDEILDLIEKGNEGKLVDIETIDKDKKVIVKVFVE